MDAALPAKLSNSGADSYANRTLKNTKFRETFEQMLDRKGLGQERIAEVHADNLQATKVVATATKEGQITDVLERPDYATRQRAVQSGWRILGKDSTDEYGSANPVIIVVRAETKRKVEKLTCPLKTNPNLERESKDSDVCKEAGNDEEAIHERTDYPQAEGSRS